MKKNKYSMLGIAQKEKEIGKSLEVLHIKMIGAQFLLILMTMMRKTIWMMMKMKMAIKMTGR